MDVGYDLSPVDEGSRPGTATRSSPADPAVKGGERRPPLPPLTSMSSGPSRVRRQAVRGQGERPAQEPVGARYCRYGFGVVSGSSFTLT